MHFEKICEEMGANRLVQKKISDEENLEIVGDTAQKCKNGGRMNGLKFPSCLSIERWISHDSHIRRERGTFVRAFER